MRKIFFPNSDLFGSYNKQYKTFEKIAIFWTRNLYLHMKFSKFVLYIWLFYDKMMIELLSFMLILRVLMYIVPLT